MKKNIVIVTKRKKEEKYFEQIRKSNYGFKFILINSKDELTFEKILNINPKYIFVVHWPWLVSKNITSNFPVVLFHMTDLPYGRGGSPLQNLIINGHKKTQISAIKMTEELDAGDVYFKTPMSLNGTAQQIYNRTSRIIFNRMIPRFLAREIAPQKQEGIPTYFNRRNPKQSEINLKESDINSLYDFIRMLDDDEYPRAFLTVDDFIFTFSKPRLDEKKIDAYVSIMRRK